MAAHSLDASRTARATCLDNLNEWSDRKIFEEGVKPESCHAQWYAGEHMDWQLAVGKVF